MIKTRWCHHEMKTFPALLALCEGNPPVTSGFPSQRRVSRSFDVFFDLRWNKQLSKQSRHRWSETPSRLLWRHCNRWHMRIRASTTRGWLRFSCLRTKRGIRYLIKFAFINQHLVSNTLLTLTTFPPLLTHNALIKVLSVDKASFKMRWQRCLFNTCFRV